jgi:hypothetical protein
MYGNVTTRPHVQLLKLKKKKSMCYSEEEDMEEEEEEEETRECGSAK